MERADSFGDIHPMRLSEMIGDSHADKYDYVIFDCSPSSCPMTLAALCACDILIVPILLDAFSVDNLNHVRDAAHGAEAIRGWEVPFFVLPNMVTRTIRQMAIYTDLTGRHDYPIMCNCIRRSEDIARAASLKKAVRAHRGKSAAAADIRDAAEEILNLAQAGGRGEG